MLPLEARAGGGKVAPGDPARVPQGVEDVCQELQKEDGIAAVRLGRQVQERRTVSQVRPGCSLFSAALSVSMRVQLLLKLP